MSRRRPGSQPQKTITHPNDPSISVVVRKGKRAEFEHYNEILFRPENRTIRLIYADQGKVAKDKDGDDRMYVDQRIPMEANIEGMRICLVSWSGVNDADGSSLPFGVENFGELYEAWLDCDIDEPVKDAKDGEPTTKKDSITFGAYINRQMTKDGFFDPDPTVPDSAPS